MIIAMTSDKQMKYNIILNANGYKLSFFYLTKLKSNARESYIFIYIKQNRFNIDIKLTKCILLENLINQQNCKL